VGAARNRASLSYSSEIPDKLYFKIGEVADLVGVQAHVLRYWEKEIPFVRPGKTTSNQRRYRRRDVELFREIRRLLHQERYTLAGARKRMMGGDKGAAEVVRPDSETRSRQEPARNPEPAEPALTSEGPVDPAGKDDSCQLPLGFTKWPQAKRNEDLRAGLVELIRMAGEDP